MSVNESTESTETLYQTPTAIVIESEEPAHEELEPSRQDEALSASPDLSGPVTRSGKKRKNPGPVKSSGKKKNKTMNMIRSPRWAQRLINLEIPVLVRSLKSSNVELG